MRGAPKSTHTQIPYTWYAKRAIIDDVLMLYLFSTKRRTESSHKRYLIKYFYFFSLVCTLFRLVVWSRIVNVLAIHFSRFSMLCSCIFTIGRLFLSMFLCCFMSFLLESHIFRLMKKHKHSFFFLSFSPVSCIASHSLQFNINFCCLISACMPLDYAST